MRGDEGGCQGLGMAREGTDPESVPIDGHASQRRDPSDVDQQVRSVEAQVQGRAAGSGHRRGSAPPRHRTHRLRGPPPRFPRGDNRRQAPSSASLPQAAYRCDQSVSAAIASSEPRLFITTGGTGLSPRDVTPEALETLCTRKIEGFGELLRQNGAKHIQTAWLSRSFAGMVGKTLVIALPGSPKAVREGIEALAALLPHALKTMDGARHG